LGRGDIAPKHTHERDPEADEEHEERGHPGAGRDEGAERHQRRPDQGGGHVGSRPWTPETTEVGHDEQREAAEGDEDRDLRIADHEPRDGEGRGDDERRPRGAAHACPAGVIRQPQPRLGAPRRRHSHSSVSDRLIHEAGVALLPCSDTL
jgi:hypothetical protein